MEASCLIFSSIRDESSTRGMNSYFAFILNELLKMNLNTVIQGMEEMPHEVSKSEFISFSYY